MSIDFAILGLLSWRPMSGYDIKKMFSGSAAFYWSGNNNQIYTTLVRLHKSGLVSQEVELPAEGPVRKIYSVTPQGQAALKEWLLSEPEPPQLRNPFLVQLAWADFLSAPELQTLLDKYESEVQVQLSMLEIQKKQKNLAPSGRNRDAYINAAQARTRREAVLWGMIQENWISFYENELRWVRKLRKQLGKQ